MVPGSEYQRDTDLILKEMGDHQGPESRGLQVRAELLMDCSGRSNCMEGGCCRR